MIIESLQEAKTINELVNIIKKFYSQYDENAYIPAVYKEGNFLYNGFDDDNNDDSCDFYAKMIVRPYNSELNNSWLKNNMTQFLIDGSSILESKKFDSNDFIYNVIVHRKMYGNYVYCYNPLLIGGAGYIDEENYKNDDIVNNLYDDGNVRAPVLRKEGDNIFIFKKALEDNINYDKYTYPKYCVSIEFEYRNTVLHIQSENNYKDKGVFIKNESFSNNEKKGKKGVLWLTGTMDIQVNIKNDDSLDIVTNSISGGQRPINENNYNDDMDAGLIVFDYSCLEYLQKRYIIIGLNMLDTFSKESYIIDPLEDIVVFWEGEFNKLPREVKKQMEQYNNKKRTKKIISGLMFEWQLNANWNYMDKAEPYQRLALYLVENYKELVLEYKCDIILPKDINIFKKQVKNILRITKLELGDLRIVETINSDFSTTPQYKEIVHIMEEKATQITELINLFQFFCLLVLDKVDKEYAFTLLQRSN